MAGLIPQNILDQIQDRVDIVEVIGNYITLKRTGRNFKALCPFHHEKTASFVVNPDKQIYHCFGCGEGGNVFGFVMKFERLDFPETVKMLAKKAGVEVPAVTERTASSQTDYLYKINELAGNYYHDILQKSPQALLARDYLTKRGIKSETVEKFKLGFALDLWDGFLNYARGKGIKEAALEKNGLVLPGKERGYYDRFRGRLIFPIFNVKGQPVAFGARVLDKSLPKYINSPETPVYIKGYHLYGLNFAAEHIRNKDFCLIVEGYLDLITPYEAGFKNIVASLGTSLTIEQVKLIKRYTKNVVMVYDPDSAGEAATLRGLDLFIEEEMMVKVITLAPGLDPDDFIKQKGEKAFEEMINKALDLFDYKLGLLAAKYNIKDLVQKSKVVGEMLPTIAKIPNAVLKSGYIKRLAQRLSVGEDDLLSELKKVKKDYSYIPQAQEAKAKTQTVIPPAEKILASLMLEDSVTISVVKSNLNVDDFSHAKIKKVVQKLFELDEQGEKFTAGKIMSHLEENGDIIPELVETAECLGDRQKNLSDCISKLKKEKRKGKIELIQERIKLAQAKGDEFEIKELIAECCHLIREESDR